MLASELVERLKDLIREHGDGKVVIAAGDARVCDAGEVSYVDGGEFWISE